ncbi:hypothetical protein [Chitinimonas taiwanensis]|uniref:hypothetical protein n=1 Tax=Chitinimonas taiwanensis TaxID=240412 RepID=UPI0035ADDD0B
MMTSSTIVSTFVTDGKYSVALHPRAALFGATLSELCLELLSERSVLSELTSLLDVPRNWFHKSVYRFRDHSLTQATYSLVMSKGKTAAFKNGWTEERLEEAAQLRPAHRLGHQAPLSDFVFGCLTGYRAGRYPQTEALAREIDLLDWALAPLIASQDLAGMKSELHTCQLLHRLSLWQGDDKRRQEAMANLASANTVAELAERVASIYEGVFWVFLATLEIDCFSWGEDSDDKLIRSPDEAWSFVSLLWPHQAKRGKGFKQVYPCGRLLDFLYIRAYCNQHGKRPDKAPSRGDLVSTLGLSSERELEKLQSGKKKLPLRRFNQIAKSEDMPPAILLCARILDSMLIKRKDHRDLLSIEPIEVSTYLAYWRATLAEANGQEMRSPISWPAWFTDQSSPSSSSLVPCSGTPS